MIPTEYFPFYDLTGQITICRMSRALFALANKGIISQLLFKCAINPWRELVPQCFLIGI